MTDLSRAARSVLDAAAFCKPGFYLSIAAALEAVADQVVPYEKAPDLMRSPDLERLAQRQHTRAQLFTIAAELRGTTTTNQEGCEV